MRRRWSRAAVVACLLLLAAACAESSRPLPAGETAAAVRPRSAFEVVVAGLVGIGLGHRWRPGGMGGLVDDDKRRVPTGPNPLHNR
ncbi:hypothetical protein E2562_004171 [Oryza meyeriana var. granulata]|uniref:Uncharacterized protein n=1 Tax=Oryza meyeriana var. granulata TaxID=110450 RepID=A0A6G1BSE1_9ORYZ|nr:hypothetical protein E2562_004171 [Oryza meyeriana var. granulata]